jgi:hypothetical protein
MPDFGFVGPSYTTPSIYQDAQECINLYPEIDPLKQPGDRGVVALYPTPGLTKLFTLNNAPVRGMRALSGGQYLVIVCGATVYSVDTSENIHFIGTLTTSAGPVSITDNVNGAQGLYCYIADGVNRYVWVVSPSSFQPLPSTDGPWQGANIVDVVDNYIVYNQPNTRDWAATDLASPYSTNAYYGVKDSSPDTLVSLICDHRQVYLFGEKTTEVWIDVGNQISGITSFPFARVAGTSMQHGIAAPFSLARFAEQFLFVSKDERGQAIIGGVIGYQFQRVSTHAVEATLAGQYIADAIAYTYQIEGHEFYVVTFPTVDITWVYDLQSKMWHKWLSLDSSGIYHRHRSNCGAFFNNVNIVGDYQNGNIYILDFSNYTENGNTIRRLRRAPHLTTDLQRQYFDELQIQFQPGIGLNGQTFTNKNLSPTSITIAPSGTYVIAPTQVVNIYYTFSINGETVGANPQAMLRWSNDGGSTWSNEHWVGIGQIGRYKNRAIWRRLGMARDRIFEVSVSDPIKCVIVSANLKASVGSN